MAVVPSVVPWYGVEGLAVVSACGMCRRMWLVAIQSAVMTARPWPLAAAARHIPTAAAAAAGGRNLKLT